MNLNPVKVFIYLASSNGAVEKENKRGRRKTLESIFRVLCIVPTLSITTQVECNPIHLKAVLNLNPTVR